MASLALMAVGSYMGWGGTVLTIAGMVGSYIDQAYIMPALFPVEQQKMSIGKLNDLQLQSASEGMPINRCYGDATPCYGQVIWLSDLIEEVYTDEEGGKGGSTGGVEITTYTYFVDVAIGVCKGSRGISHIWADSKLIYLDESFKSAITISNLIGEISVVVTSYCVGGNAWEGFQYVKVYAMKMVFDYGGELPDLEVGRPVGLSGFTGIYEPNGGQYNLSSMVLNDDGMVELMIANPNAVAQTLVGGLTRILSQQSYVTSGQYDSITIYNGDIYNIPDPTIESYKEVGNVPAYKGLCYVVFHRLKLTDYGNRLPNLRFLVRDSIEAPS